MRTIRRPSPYASVGGGRPHKDAAATVGAEGSGDTSRGNPPAAGADDSASSAQRPSQTQNTINSAGGTDRSLRGHAALSIAESPPSFHHERKEGRGGRAEQRRQLSLPLLLVSAAGAVLTVFHIAGAVSALFRLGAAPSGGEASNLGMRSFSTDELFPSPSGEVEALSPLANRNTHAIAILSETEGALWALTAEAAKKSWRRQASDGGGALFPSSRQWHGALGPLRALKASIDAIRERSEGRSTAAAVTFRGEGTHGQAPQKTPLPHPAVPSTDAREESDRQSAPPPPPPPPATAGGRGAEGVAGMAESKQDRFTTTRLRPAESSAVPSVGTPAAGRQTLPNPPKAAPLGVTTRGGSGLGAALDGGTGRSIGGGSEGKSSAASALAKGTPYAHFDANDGANSKRRSRGGRSGLATEAEANKLRRSLMAASFPSLQRGGGEDSSEEAVDRSSFSSGGYATSYDLGRIRWRPLPYGDGDGNNKEFTKDPLPTALRRVQHVRSRSRWEFPLDSALRSCAVATSSSSGDSADTESVLAAAEAGAIRRFHCLLTAVDAGGLYGDRLFDSYSWQTTPLRDLEGGGGGGGGGAASPPAAETCGDVYGLGLVRRLKRARTVVCESPAGKEGEGGGKRGGGGSPSVASSTVQCAATFAHPSHSVPTAVCSADAAVVDFSRAAMGDGDYPWLAFQKGALTVACEDRRLALTAGRADGRVAFAPKDLRFMHCLADWMDLGYTPVGSSSKSGAMAGCQPSELSSEAHMPPPPPTYFLTRSGDFSPFAAVHDYLNTFIAFMVEHETIESAEGSASVGESGVESGAAGGGAQIIVMDRMGMGFYAPMLQLLFAAPSTRIQWFPDLRDASSSSSSQQQCFQKAIFNIPARLSPIYNYDSCRGSALLRLFADAMLLAVGAYRFTSPPNVLVVTVITRLDYGATGHSIGRRIGNHDQLVAALRSRLDGAKLRAISDEAAATLRGGASRGNEGEAEEETEGTFSSSSPISIVVNNVDFAAYDFDQQLAISRATDVLVGMHGAGLVQALFMGGGRGARRRNGGDGDGEGRRQQRQRGEAPAGMGAGGVFEIFCPEKPSSNYRYNQLARRLGLAYDSYESGSADNAAPPDAVVPMIQRLAEEVWRRRVQR